MSTQVIDEVRALEDLRIFAAFVEREGLPPTVREFTDAGGFSSTSVAQYHLKRLAEFGWLERRPGPEYSSRGWRVTKKGQRQTRTMRL